MKLKELANLLLIKETIGNMDVEITGLEMDSRKITDGDLFICVSGIDGFLEDRHQFVEDAVKNGAVALIVERDVNIEIPKIVDRELAITHAINMASSNDIVLIAGKGHETYQILKDSTIHFDDKEKARQAIINK
ncbi:UDP-N-acetylmuramoylalanyl-D-glutamate--26- diaminopimelate ligase [Bacillus cereus]|nr:UDP-N-acetylmuramoylalanyl-D-glutamate--26- diaminopimelate ligase [Bacillus cereus]